MSRTLTATWVCDRCNRKQTTVTTDAQPRHEPIHRRVAIGDTVLFHGLICNACHLAIDAAVAAAEQAFMDALRLQHRGDR